MQLQGARVLVTGGARGLGRRFVLDLIAAGARVGTCDMDALLLEELSEQDAREVEKMLAEWE